MKVCPSCRTSYDDSQNFCLNDGTPLIVAEAEPEIESETDTVIADNNVERDLRRPPPPSSTSSQTVDDRNVFRSSPPLVVPTGAAAAPPTPPASSPSRHQTTPQIRLMKRRSYTGLIVGLSALAAALLLGSAWWMFSRNGDDFARSNTNNYIIPSPSVIGESNANTVSPSGNTAAKRTTNVSNQAANQSVSVPGASLPPPGGSEAPPAETAPPIEQPQPPQPPLSGRAAAQARGEAQSVLNNWIAALRSGDLNAHLAFYADTVDYYRGRYGRNQILADKQRAFREFDDIEMRASNVRITNLTATTATVLYDKEWRFANDAKVNEGKVLSELKLTKFGDRWLITGERDLRVYYTRNV